MLPNQKPILQLHPTRRCNLRCLHCYSASGPEQRDLLPPSTFERVISDARSEGYAVASFSGGEPTLYKPLPHLLRHATACGMLTTVTSNGMLLTSELLSTLQGVTDVLAISLDGPREAHNRMRGSERAFDAMEACLPAVRASGIPFGFIFTLTQHNLHETAWAAEFAHSHGATLFQIHPLEQVGRAVDRLPGSCPDDIEAGFAYLEVERIRELYKDSMFVQFDLVHSAVLRRHPDSFFDEREAMDRPLGDLLSPLVVESDGRVVPFGYGFSQRHALGFLTDAPLSELAAAFRRRGYRELQDVCRAAFQDATQPRDFPVLNWWDKLVEFSA